jgi:hypothetical protein
VHWVSIPKVKAATEALCGRSFSATSIINNPWTRRSTDLPGGAGESLSLPHP